VSCFGNSYVSGGSGVTPNLPQGFLRLAVLEFLIDRGAQLATAKLFECQVLKVPEVVSIFLDW